VFWMIQWLCKSEMVLSSSDTGGVASRILDILTILPARGSRFDRKALGSC